MPREWHLRIDKATVTHPEGHNTYCSVKWERQESHHTTVWFIRVPSQSEIPVVSPQFGIQECVPNTLKWRSVTDILINLNQYVFHQSLVLIIQGAQRQHRAHQTQAGRPIVERTNLQRAPWQKRGHRSVCRVGDDGRLMCRTWVCQRDSYMREERIVPPVVKAEAP